MPMPGKLSYAQLHARVWNFDDGQRLGGYPTEELIAQSRLVEDTGAVPAFWNKDEALWEYVAPSDVERVRALGRNVLTVYIVER